jgi:hypothetical protein
VQRPTRADSEPGEPRLPRPQHIPGPLQLEIHNNCHWQDQGIIRSSRVSTVSQCALPRSITVASESLLDSDSASYRDGARARWVLLPPRPPASWPGLGPADPDPHF